jgi:hypothetical protein
MMFAPLEGWRDVKVTDQRAAVDYAQMLKELSDTYFPKASRIVLVQDNLSTHEPASLYEAFPAAGGRRLVECFESRYTPTLLRMALHAQARQLARHGGKRTQCAVLRPQF